jgi:hypothetical protein
MWEVDQALAERTRFTQLDTGRWKAEYHGFVTVTAEGDTPTQSERQLSRALDVLLASLIRGGKDREKRGTAGKISALMLSDAITVVKNTAKETARLKKDWGRVYSSKLDESEETRSPAELKQPRKRR